MDRSHFPIVVTTIHVTFASYDILCTAWYLTYNFTLTNSCSMLKLLIYKKCIIIMRYVFAFDYLTHFPINCRDDIHVTFCYGILFTACAILNNSYKFIQLCILIHIILNYSILLYIHAYVVFIWCVRTIPDEE